MNVSRLLLSSFESLIIIIILVLLTNSSGDRYLGDFVGVVLRLTTLVEYTVRLLMNVTMRARWILLQELVVNVTVVEDHL